MRTQRLNGSVTKTMSQEIAKRIHPHTPMLWLAFSSAGEFSYDYRDGGETEEEEENKTYGIGDDFFHFF